MTNPFSKFKTGDKVIALKDINFVDGTCHIKGETFIELIDNYPLFIEKN